MSQANQKVIVVEFDEFHTALDNSRSEKPDVTSKEWIEGLKERMKNESALLLVKLRPDSIQVWGLDGSDLRMIIP